jgi:monoterpene epsilon-lactone hydrolase
MASLAAARTALLSVVLARRWLGWQTGFERAVFLAAAIIGNLAVGAVEALARRAARGRPQHPVWSLRREVVYGAARRVLAYAQRLFERDPESIRAWTHIQETVDFVPRRYMLGWLHGLESCYVRLGGVACCAVFEPELRARVEARLLEGCGGDEELVYVLHAHGGGYVAGGLHAAQGVSVALLRQGRSLAPRTARRLVFVHVDYTLGVDARFPRAVQDKVRCFDALVAKGVSGARIMLQGESGGGGLAACTLLALRDSPAFLGARAPEARRERPRAAILLSPMLDLVHDAAYCAEREQLDLIQGPLARVCARNYVDEEHQRSPYATPIFADSLDLPPLLVQTGGIEIFDDSIRRFCDKARADGTSVTYEAYEGMPHVFQLLGCEVGDKAVGAIWDFIKCQLDTLDSDETRRPVG